MYHHDGWPRTCGFARASVSERSGASGSNLNRSIPTWCYIQDAYCVLCGNKFSCLHRPKRVNFSHFMRVLIATVTAGGGHLAAAAALEEAWKAARPSDTLEKVDVLDFASKLYRKL